MLGQGFGKPISSLSVGSNMNRQDTHPIHKIPEVMYGICEVFRASCDTQIMCDIYMYSSSVIHTQD